jgi:hypothetical protein
MLSHVFSRSSKASLTLACLNRAVLGEVWSRLNDIPKDPASFFLPHLLSGHLLYLVRLLHTTDGCLAGDHSKAEWGEVSKSQVQTESPVVCHEEEQAMVYGSLAGEPMS